MTSKDLSGPPRSPALARGLALSMFGLVAAAATPAHAGLAESVDSAFGAFNGILIKVLFFDVLFFTDAAELPLAVFWLVAGATFFTIRMGFINVRAFRHAIHVVRGFYDNPADKGEVSHFQALATALSATVGLGNIAGVAVAVSLGGPGATFWMIVAGLLGMSSKMVECTLGQTYREIRADGHVMGGAMEYLSRGLKARGMAGFGKVLAVMFSVMCIGGSFGGGNAFQVNQSMSAVSETFPFFAEHRWLYGLIMAALTGIVIIGGVKRIASVADKIVPLMCGVYVLACLWVLLTNLSQVPSAFGTIVSEAFKWESAYGGMVGVLVMGFRRAAFSNEAGVGSAAIAHAAAKTEYPVREGIVALLEPFIDTVVICTMTALVIVITGAYANPEYAEIIKNGQGATLTSKAFGQNISWFPMVLSVAVFLFAYSTMISWSYYGERCWAYLFGEKWSLLYKTLFILFAFLGSITTAMHVLEFSDLMILAMAFPNILGCYIMSGEVRTALDAYMTKLRSGQMTEYRTPNPKAAEVA